MHNKDECCCPDCCQAREASESQPEQQNHGLDANEYRHFCRMLAAVLDRASKAELLAFDLAEAQRLNRLLEEENDRLKRDKI